MKISFLVVAIAPVPFLFPFCTLCTQFMLILILINVQYSQKAVFRFEKGSEYEISLPQVPSPPSKIEIPPPAPSPQHIHTHPLQTSHFKRIILLTQKRYCEIGIIIAIN